MSQRKNPSCFKCLPTVLLALPFLLGTPPLWGQSGDQPASTVKIEFALDKHVEEHRCWIGAKTRPICPIVKSQMKLPCGLAVLELADNSPARRAGLQPFDILVRMGKTKLESGETLSRVIDLCGHERVNIDLIRGGKNMRLEIRPEIRPDVRVVPLVIVADQEGQFDLRDARQQIQSSLRSGKQENFVPVFEVVLINPAIAYPLPKFNAADQIADSDTTTLVNASSINSVDWSNEDAKAVELIRLQVDMESQLEEIERLQAKLYEEQLEIQRMLENTHQEQQRLKQMLDWQLEQFDHRYDTNFFRRLRRQTDETEASFIQWRHMLNRLHYYRKSLSRATSQLVEK